MEIDGDSVSYISDFRYAHEYTYQRRRQIVWLLIIMIVLIGFFICLISFVPPIQGILSNKEKILASQLEGRPHSWEHKP
ncbi:MAG: hypothetical protein JSW26_04455 [Desulfobacterales bacterium]|nr:MAG: hypothetical protein JSW26_04455 [Desulfobacterales bacterium]